MAVITDKSIFFHIPKTGGTWVTRVLLDSIPSARKLEYYAGERVRWDGQHVPTNRINSRGRKTFCFVRHPLEWYKSLWRYHNTDGDWEVSETAQDPLDLLCPHKEFNIFIDKVIETFPNGYLHWIVEPFIAGVDYIGRQERLVFDLMDILDSIGEDYSTYPFLSEHINRSDPKECEYTEDQRIKIIEMERPLIERFYDNDSLIGIQPVGSN